MDIYSTRKRLMDMTYWISVIMFNLGNECD